MNAWIKCPWITKCSNEKHWFQPTVNLSVQADIYFCRIPQIYSYTQTFSSLYYGPFRPTCRSLQRLTQLHRPYIFTVIAHADLLVQTDIPRLCGSQREMHLSLWDSLTQTLKSSIPFLPPLSNYESVQKH